MNDFFRLERREIEIVERVKPVGALDGERTRRIAREENRKSQRLVPAIVGTVDNTERRILVWPIQQL